MKSGSPSFDRRRAARQMACQALYQLYMNADSASAIEQQFLQDQDFKRVDKKIFSQLLHGAVKHQDELDDAITPHLDRSLQALNPIEHVILRMGTFELLHSLHVPYKVVINEAVELTKTFGAADGHKYVNGILDQVALQHRQPETAAKR